MQGTVGEKKIELFGREMKTRLGITMVNVEEHELNWLQWIQLNCIYWSNWFNQSELD